MSEGEKKGAFRAALRHRDYRRLALATLVSMGGDWLYNIAYLVFVYGLTRSAVWLAVASMTRLLPWVVFGTVGGTVADRFDRKRVMIAADLFRAGCMGLLAVDAAAWHSPLVSVLLALAACSASTAFTPASAGLVPRVVGEEDLAAANAVNTTIESTAVVVGPAAGSLLLLLHSATAAFAINGATFLVSAVLVASIAAHVPPVKVQQAAGMLRQIADGVKALRQSPTALALISFEFGVSFLYGAAYVLFVLVSKEVLGAGDAGFGWLIGASGLGGVIMAPLAARLLDRGHQILILAAGPIVGGLAFAATGLVAFLPLSLLCALVFGATNVLVDVIALTLLQRAASPRTVGRIFGVAFTAFMLSIALGSAVASPLVRLLGARWGTVACGLGIAALTCMALPWTVRLERRLEARRLALAPLADLLQGLRIFEGAARSSVEMLAASVGTLEVAAGVRVITEGDPADYFYVVHDGALEVTRRQQDGSDRIVGRLAPGEYFGEMGLLQEGIRTASVTTTATTALYRVTGDEFVDAINRGSSVSPALGNTMAWRRASYDEPAEEVRTAAASPSSPVPAP